MPVINSHATSESERDADVKTCAGSQPSASRLGTPQETAETTQKKLAQLRNFFATRVKSGEIPDSEEDTEDDDDDEEFRVNVDANDSVHEVKTSPHAGSAASRADMRLASTPGETPEALQAPHCNIAKGSMSSQKRKLSTSAAAEISEGTQKRLQHYSVTSSFFGPIEIKDPDDENQSVDSQLSGTT
ncbi:hypothetical protein BBO_08296 [Beauveria brongniartii RCEF 3172]|uniref:Uncharacterized protein n=1 Tax=Beauveria brongniartii RCEF 3172 TaxID=1081107 RepID=A0A166XS97_9HYPO|nr:hypothetical protein BBO_08296 [Beauveria brongniartii RCEF 3172]